MQSRRWFCLCAVATFGTVVDLAFGQGNGHGKGHRKDRDDDDRNQGDYYRDSDREEMRRWYAEQRENLPPGLAKRDQLPPGLEKQLVRRGTLPPGLQKRIELCPPEETARRIEQLPVAPLRQFCRHARDALHENA